MMSDYIQWLGMTWSRVINCLLQLPPAYFFIRSARCELH